MTLGFPRLVVSRLFGEENVLGTRGEKKMFLLFAYGLAEIQEENVYNHRRLYKGTTTFNTKFLSRAQGANVDTMKQSKVVVPIQKITSSSDEEEKGAGFVLLL